MLVDIVLLDDTVADHVKDALAEAEGDPVVDPLIVPVPDTDLVTVGLTLTDPDLVIDGVPVPVMLTERV